MRQQQRIRIDADEKPERNLLVYKYHAKTGQFCGTRLVPGERYGSGDTVYILKVNETFEEPPIVDDEHVAVFLERTRTWVEVELPNRAGA
jgi:hypothetical protein